MAFRFGLKALQMICELEILLLALSAVLIVLNESNIEVKELRTCGHTVCGEMRIA